MYSNSPFKYYCYLRFYRHPWLPSYHSTITLCDLIQIHGFSTRIWWWLWLWQVLFLAYLTVQCTSPLNFIGTVNLKSANLNSPFPPLLFPNRICITKKLNKSSFLNLHSLLPLHLLTSLSSLKMATIIKCCSAFVDLLLY